jgi:hypothetical protein
VDIEPLNGKKAKKNEIPCFSTQPRQRPDNVKDAVVKRREFETLRLRSEEVAEFNYQPTACSQEYRMIVVRKNITKEKGELRLFDEVRYFFYITNDWVSEAAEIVFLANDRCDQENLIAQLQSGCRALKAPVDNLVSNWAYMVMTALAWDLKAWWALSLPEGLGRHRESYRADKLWVLWLEFKTFVQAFVRVPSQIVRTGMATKASNADRKNYMHDTYSGSKPLPAGSRGRCAQPETASRCEKPIGFACLRANAARKVAPILVPELDAEVDALGREIAFLEREGRASRPNQCARSGGGRNLGQIDRAIDLITGTRDVAPVEERVADIGSDMVGNLIPEIEPDFRNHGKGVVLVMPDVRGQGQNAAGRECRLAAGRCDHGRAVDIDRLVCIAEGHLGGDIDEGAASPPFGAGAKLAAVEVVMCRESIEHTKSCCRRSWEPKDRQSSFR